MFKSVELELIRKRKEEKGKWRLFLLACGH